MSNVKEDFSPISGQVTVRRSIDGITELGLRKTKRSRKRPNFVPKKEEDFQIDLKLESINIYYSK